MTRDVQIVDAEPPLIKLVNHGGVAGYVDYLTKDEARSLSVQLDDACDELELAEGVSGP